jgi:ubiquinone/menaquinone biosynthesis C-methylase UbiE
VSPSLDPEILRYYAAGLENDRLRQGPFQLERARTEELLKRHLPPPPATVLDVGGGSGPYACRLAEQGYEVTLLDPVPLHVEQARRAAAALPAGARLRAEPGDARELPAASQSADAVLLLGPLYHLTERPDRLRALREAGRVLRPRGVALLVGISRFASLLAGLSDGADQDPAFVEIVERDLRDGQHRNPSGPLDWFTTAFFHRPDELQAEIEEAGLRLAAMYGIEGPGWLAADFAERWADETRRRRLLHIARAVEREEWLLAVSPHIMAVAERP